MTTLYFVKGHNNTRAPGKDGWALAGDAGHPSPGNWIETTDADFGRALEAKHGPRVEIGKGGWNSFPADYRTGTPTSSTVVEFDYDKLAAALKTSAAGQYAAYTITGTATPA